MTVSDFEMIQDISTSAGLTSRAACDVVTQVDKIFEIVIESKVNRFDKVPEEFFKKLLVSIYVQGYARGKSSDVYCGDAISEGPQRN